MVVKRRLMLSGKGSAKRVKKESIVSLTSKPTYRGDKSWFFDLPGLPLIYSTTVTTGLIAQTYDFNPQASLVGWSSRFGSTFDEYRVVRCSVECIPIGINNGVTALFMSETNLGTPTIFEAEERRAQYLKNNLQFRNNKFLYWRAQDTSDETWFAIGNSHAFATVSIYTDNANLGSPVAVVPLVMIRPLYRVQFRGLRST